MADEKVLDLLEKIYIELQGTKQEIKEELTGIKKDISELKEDVAVLKEDVAVLKEDVAGLKQELSRTNERLDSLEVAVKKTNEILEKDIEPKMEILFKGYKENTEAITKIDEHVDVLQLETNALIARTAYNSQCIDLIDKLVKAK